VALLALGACTAAPAPVAVAPPPPAPLLDPDATCLKDLHDMQVAFEPMPGYEKPGSCGVANPVRMAGGAATGWNRPGVLSCTMARTIERFEEQVVQPLALRHFGQRVVRLHHMGTYDCRQQRNETTAAAAANGSRGGRLSEHSKGRAIDVGAFELADGTMVSVKKDWRGAGKRAEFLHDVARLSCDTFNVVLTPNHDRFHHDHLHLDIGPHRLCGY
jgi:hypothetical protein